MRIWRSASWIALTKSSEPNDSAREEVREEWHDLHGMYVRIEWLMCTCMNFELRGQFNNSYANEIIDGLKALFSAQVRVARYECLDEFLSTMMEEKTCIDQHLVRMHEIHQRLTYVWDYWMADEWAMDIVLRSLPISYKSFVRDFVMKGEQFPFFTSMERLRTAKVEPVEAEIVDPEGIYDIQIYKCFSFTLVTVL